MAYVRSIIRPPQQVAEMSADDLLWIFTRIYSCVTANCSAVQHVIRCLQDPTVPVGSGWHLSDPISCGVSHPRTRNRVWWAEGLFYIGRWIRLEIGHEPYMVVSAPTLTLAHARMALLYLYRLPIIAITEHTTNKGICNAYELTDERGLVASLILKEPRGT